MYQPISFNVIRQALDWHKMPIPTLRELSYYDCFTDFISAEYLCVWTDEQLRQFAPTKLLHDGSYAYTVFANQLRECFCDDVKVVELHFDPLKEELRGLLYVTISREVANFALGDWLSS